jgi:signal transduction histidine kinase
VQTERLLTCLQKAVGHELPNHLVGLQGFIRLMELEEGEHLGPDGKVYLRRLAAGVRQTHELIKALAEVVRFGRQQLSSENVEPGEVFEEVVAEVKQLSPDQGIIYDWPRQAPALVVPRTALRLVLCRLLHQVMLAARPGETRRVEITVEAVPLGVEVRVVTDGQRVPVLHLAQLFEPFTGNQGTGLELFLARQLVESWGGTIRAEDHPDGGWAFVFTAPAAVSDQQSAVSF